MPADIVNSGERFLGLAALRERNKREEERGVQGFIVEGWHGGGARVSASDRRLGANACTGRTPARGGRSI
jgi:hypothetical protein